MKQLNGVESEFFHLLKISLGIDSAPFTRAGIDGKFAAELFRLVHAQGLSAVMYDTAAACLSNTIPENIAMDWFALRHKVEDWNRKQRRTLSELNGYLTRGGVRMVLLKGCGTSLLYPNPLLRECGDIDIYCGADYDKVNKMALQAGLEISKDDGKHSSFNLNGIPVENHRKMNYEGLNRANAVVGKHMTQMMDEQGVVSDELGGILLPSPTAFALHQMTHTLTHLVWSGIPVRNLADWALLLRRDGPIIDWSRLHGIWEEAGMLRPVALLNSICIDWLGTDRNSLGEEFLRDIESMADKRTADFILKDILRPVPAPASCHSKVMKLKVKTKRYLHRRRRYRIVYGESLPDGPVKGILGKNSPSAQQFD